MVALMVALTLGPWVAADTLRGVVQDTAGRPVASALVSIGAKELRTDAAGRWVLPGSAAFEPPRVRVPGYRVVTVQAVEGGWLVVVRPEALALAPLVVTAARRPQPLSDASAAVSVWDHAALRRTGGASIADALERLGVVVLDAGVGAGLGPVLDGLGEQRVLVLLDGQPWDGRVGGRIDLSRLPLTGVERIEVVRGPQSVLFGTGAMGGVIHVLTRPPRGRDLRASVGWGSVGQRGGELAAEAGGARVGVAAAGGWQRSGLVPGRGDVDAAGKSDRGHGSLRLEWMPSAWRLRVRTLSAWDRHRWRAGSLYQFVDDHEGQAQVELARRFDTGEIAARFMTHAFQHRFRRSASVAPPDPGPAERHRREEGELTFARTDAAGGWSLGLEAGRQTLVSDRLIAGRRTRTELNVFLQRDWRVPRGAVTPGLRWAWSGDWGGAWIPRLASRWDVAPATALFVAVGRSYRVPDFKEQGIAFVNRNAGGGYVVEGNPDLRPEDAWGATADLRGRAGPWRWELHAYGQRLRGLITAVYAGERDGLSLYRYANVERATVWGGEAAAEAVFGLWTVGVRGALQRSRWPSGRALPGRPPLHGTGRLEWAPAPSLAVAVYGRWLAPTPLGTNDPVRRPTAWRADATASWHWKAHWRFELVADRWAAGGAAWPEWGPRRLAWVVRWGSTPAKDDARISIGGW